MTRARWPSPMLVWAARELWRRPAAAMLLFTGLASTVALVGFLLLWHQSMARTYLQLMDHSPTVVVRRVEAGGWAPLPVSEAITAAGRVPGVLQPHGRVWGVVSGPTGAPVTIVGTAEPMETSLSWPSVVPQPAPGQAVLGPGFEGNMTTAAVHLAGRVELALQVVGRLPAHSGLATHDVVVIHADDARRLLGLTPGMVSDLVLEVFRTEEVEAVCGELATAFPWPVQIMTRQGRKQLGLETLARHNGRALLTCVPVLLALACLVGAVGMWGSRQRAFLGLFKALGWSAADILRLQAYALGLLGGLAATVGLAAAYGLLFWPALTRQLGVWWGWDGPTHLLMPSFSGLLGSFGLTFVLVVAPFAGAGLWVARGAALSDPGDLLQI